MMLEDAPTSRDIEPNAIRLKAIVAVINEKGGVGKTTTAINLAGALALLNERVLLVDWDPQSNATHWIGDERFAPTMTVDIVLREDGDEKMGLTIGKSTIDNVYLAYGSRGLSSAARHYQENSMSPGIGLQEALASLTFEGRDLDQFSYVILDCLPGLGILSSQAIVAADQLIIPMLAEELSVAGVDQLHTTISALLKQKAIKKIKPCFHVLTMWDPRLAESLRIESQLKARPNFELMNTKIRRATAVAKACAAHRWIGDYDPNALIGDDYLHLAEEFLLHV